MDGRVLVTGELGYVRPRPKHPAMASSDALRIRCGLKTSRDRQVAGGCHRRCLTALAIEARKAAMLQIVPAPLRSRLVKNVSDRI